METHPDRLRSPLTYGSLSLGIIHPDYSFEYLEWHLRISFLLLCSHLLSTLLLYPSIRDSRMSSPSGGGGNNQKMLQYHLFLQVIRIPGKLPEQNQSLMHYQTMKPTAKIWDRYLWVWSSRKSCLENATRGSGHLRTSTGVHAGIQTATYAHCKFCFREKRRTV